MKLFLGAFLFISSSLFIRVSNLVTSFNEDSSTTVALDSVTVKSIKINSVSATANQFKNEFGYNSGWIELENTADQTICLQDGKWSISNDLKNVSLYSFKKNITIASHSKIVIWCDKLNVVQTDIHSNFKLNPQVGEIRLYHFDDDHNHKCVDSFRYNNTTAANS